jgi:hypothetical protein
MNRRVVKINDKVAAAAGRNNLQMPTNVRPVQQCQPALTTIINSPQIWDPALIYNFRSHEEFMTLRGEDRRSGIAKLAFSRPTSA